MFRIIKVGLKITKNIEIDKQFILKLALHKINTKIVELQYKNDS